MNWGSEAMEYPGLDPNELAPAVMGRGALEGLKVLDVATMMAAPWAATYLADYGADVVKAELPGKGDPVRQWGSQVDGTALAWKGLSRNKRLITLALNKPEGQQVLRRLIKDFDVLVENFRPGVMERWGLAPEKLLEINPRLIVMRTSGYGQDGPYAPKPGFGTLAEAFSGLAYVTGAEDRPPSLSGYPLADGVTALAGAMSILAALYWRDVNGGKGQIIDNAIIEANFRLIDYTMLDYEKMGVVRERSGNRLADLAPRNAYETSDGGWIAISGGTQEIVERLFRCMDRADLLDDPRFRNNAERLKNVAALDEAISSWMSVRTTLEVLRIFEENEISGAPVNNVAQIAEHEHFRARNLLLRVDDADLGPTSTVHVHPRLSETPGGIKFLGGAIGRDNEAFYLNDVGLTREEFEELRAAGVV